MRSFPTRITRDIALQLGQEAVRIIENGGYAIGDGQWIDLHESIAACVAGAKMYPPDVPFPRCQPGQFSTNINVQNTTTFAAIRLLIESGYNPVALNFASATNPGGGFLGGARAQEEYLCRSSSLYACLRDQPMYEFHRSRWNNLYTSYMIYSPDVPVFRSDEDIYYLIHIQ